MDLEYFKTQSEKYLPKKIKYLLIAESPPNDIRNFFYYDGQEPKNQMFFQNIMKAIYSEHCANDYICRKKLLNKYKEDSFFLIDAVDNYEIKDFILDDFPKLVERLIDFNKKNLIDSKTKIILIKKLVCELLKEPIENNEDIIFDKSKGVGEVGFPRFFSDTLFMDVFQNYLEL